MTRPRLQSLFRGPLTLYLCSPAYFPGAGFPDVMATPCHLRHCLIAFATLSHSAPLTLSISVTLMYPSHHGLPLSRRHVGCAGSLPGSIVLLLSELLGVGSAGEMLTPGVTPTPSSHRPSPSPCHRGLEPRASHQCPAPCRCLHLGLEQIRHQMQGCLTPPSPLKVMSLALLSWQRQYFSSNCGNGSS